MKALLHRKQDNTTEEVWIREIRTQSVPVQGAMGQMKLQPITLCTIITREGNIEVCGIENLKVSPDELSNLFDFNSNSN